jgi:tetratricopeptide (TPR) repeat protein
MTYEPANSTDDHVNDGLPNGQLGDRLDGWKAIAAHLGRDIRTVQRWELSEHLPIHRLEHRNRATPYGFARELDEWIAKRVPLPGDADATVGDPAPRSRRRGMVAGLLVLMGVVIAGVLAVRALGPGRSHQHIDTQDAQAYSAFAEGRALYASRQYANAVVTLERAVSRDPEYGAAWAVLAKAYGRLAQPMWAGGKSARNRATQTAERAARLAPEAAETHVALSLAARARGDVEAWRAEAHRAINLDPRTAEALALLGDSYSAVVYACNRDQDPELAESYYRRAMELMPNMTVTTSNRAGNLRRLGRYAECVEMLNANIRAFRDETPLLAVRGACRLMLGDVAGAREDIEPLRSNPKIAQAGSLVYLGLLELKDGRTESGIRDLEAVIQLDQSARAELIVAEAYGIAGDVGRATLHLKKAFGLDPSCAGLVATSIAFKPLRGADSVKTLLALHGIR